MAGIWRIVMGAMIPVQISSIELIKRIGKARSVEGVDINITEVERKMEIARISIIGNELDFEYIKKTIEDTGVSIQSIDRVSVGKKTEE